MASLQRETAPSQCVQGARAREEVRYSVAAVRLIRPLIEELDAAEGAQIAQEECVEIEVDSAVFPRNKKAQAIGDGGGALAFSRIHAMQQIVVKREIGP